MFARLWLFTYLLQFLAHILHPLKSTILTHTHKEKLLKNNKYETITIINIYK